MIGSRAGHFDPDFARRLSPAPGAAAGSDDSGRRRGGDNLHAFEGTQGNYVAAKVGKVFPQLQRVAGGP
jgi:polar amino acid transport system ATP-binding protein